MDKKTREHYEKLYGKPSVIETEEENLLPELPAELVPEPEPKRRVASTVGEPETFSRRDFTLPVQHQGSLGTCVGQAMKICMQDSVDYRDQPELSAMYIYYWGQRRDEWPGENYGGTSISGAGKALMEKGNVREEAWPNLVAEPPTDLAELDSLAAHRRIKNAYRIMTQDLQFEHKVQSMIRLGSMAYSFRFSPYFYTVGKDGIVDAGKFKAEGVENGGHAMAMTGFRTINGELHWEFQNSWGTGWGDQGRCYFPNSLLKEVSMRASVTYIETQSETKPKVEFKYEKKSKKTMWIVLGSIGGGLALLGLLSKLF